MRYFLEYGLVTVNTVLLTPPGMKVTSEKASHEQCCVRVPQKNRTNRWDT